MQILTFNWHESYLWLLAKTGHAFDIVLREKGYPGHTDWFHQFRPVPERSRLIDEASARLRLHHGAYDVVIAHDPSDLAMLQGIRIPKILVLHNRASTVLAMNGRQEQLDAYRSWLISLMDQAAPIRTVFISEGKRTDWGLHGEVIPPGIDLQEYGGYEGRDPRALRVGNGLRERDLMLGYSEQEAILRGGPSTVIGINPTIPGARLSDSWTDLKSLMATHRFYLHTTRDPWEDGYNLALLEAMATGMPIIALANRTSPIVDGENGFISDDLDILSGRVRSLIENRETAVSLGEAARRTVAERFPIDRFVERWEAIIGQAVCRRAPKASRVASRTGRIRSDVQVAHGDISPTRSARSLRILTFNWHEAYLHTLSHTGHDFDIVEQTKGGISRWLHEFRPVPPRAALVPIQTAKERLDRGEYDLIIAHHFTDIAQVADRRTIPILLVIHNHLSTMAALAGQPSQADQIRSKVEGLLEKMPELALVYISEAKREDWGLPGAVISPGVDPEAYGGYTGQWARVLRVGNGFQERDLMLGFRVQQSILRGLPCTTLGLNPDLPDARPSRGWEDLKTQMRLHRLYLHTTRDPWEDGYNLALLEAMATGMPIVALAHRNSPIRDGINGYLSDRPEELHDRIRALLGCPEEAHRLGESARRTVIERFPLSRFVDGWNRLLQTAVKWKHEATQGPSVIVAQRAEKMPPPSEPRRRILMAYTANPQTTAHYLERALRQNHDVITYGPDIVRYGAPVGDRIEPMWKIWDLGQIKDRVRPQAIPFQENNPDLRGVCDRLPSGWFPDIFLWVDSGNYFPLEGLSSLPCVRVAYFIDTHLNREQHLRMASEFDHVFVAQRAYIPDFKRQGCPSVHWLPLACDPDLHGGRPLPKRYDLTFVGSLTSAHSRRRDLLSRLGQSFQVHIRRCFLEEMARVYRQSRIIFNHAILNDLNMRVFEALASGSLLLTDASDGLHDLFEDQKHLVIYRDERELIDLARYYLERAEEREVIQVQGQAEVFSRHTYAHRVQALLSVLEGVSTGEEGGTRRNPTDPDASAVSGGSPSRSASSLIHTV